MTTTKKHYRITLFAESSSLTRDIAILAAIQNGKIENKLTLEDFESHFKAQCNLYPSTNERMCISVIGHKITIDKASWKADTPAACECEIEEIELVELTKSVDDLIQVALH